MAARLLGSELGLDPGKRLRASPFLPWPVMGMMWGDLSGGYAHVPPVPLLLALSGIQWGGEKRYSPWRTTVVYSQDGHPRAAGQKVGAWIFSWRQALAQRHGRQSHTGTATTETSPGDILQEGERCPKVPLSKNINVQF